MHSSTWFHIKWGLLKVEPLSGVTLWVRENNGEPILLCYGLAIDLKPLDLIRRLRAPIASKSPQCRQSEHIQSIV